MPWFKRQRLGKHCPPHGATSSFQGDRACESLSVTLLTIKCQVWLLPPQGFGSSWKQVTHSLLRFGEHKDTVILRKKWQDAFLSQVPNSYPRRKKKKRKQPFVSGETAKMISPETCGLPRRKWKVEVGVGRNAGAVNHSAQGKKRGLGSRAVRYDPEVSSINVAAWASARLVPLFPLL